MKIIGIAGKAGAGKDTVAKVLVEEFEFIQYAFARPLKEGMKVMFGLTDYDVYDSEGKEKEHPRLGMTVRRAMQLAGTEFARDMIHNDIWLRMASHFLVQTLKEKGRTACVVISDVRFKNEANWVRSNGGVIWHIEREIKKVDSHSSESGILVLSNDTVIYNHGTIDELHRNVRLFAKHEDE